MLLFMSSNKNSAYSPNCLGKIVDALETKIKTRNLDLDVIQSNKHEKIQIFRGCNS